MPQTSTLLSLPARTFLLDSAEAEMRRLDNKVRFIRYVIKGELELKNRKRADIERDLAAKGFDRLPAKSQFGKAPTQRAAEEAEDGAAGAAAADGASASYEYLLSMPLSSLTMEKVDSLLKEHTEQVR